MSKINVSAVSYTNTLPFLYGLRNSSVIEQINLSLDVPSECARKLITGEADLGVVPVGALSDIPHYQIVSQFCIGAYGAVDSVFIFSTKPITEIRTLRLDTQSRTSNVLAKILLKYYWKLTVEFVSEGDADAYVEIGDRTFGKKDHYEYHYDLAHYWKLYKKLPFAFAVWVANKPLSADFLHAFNEALSFGVAHAGDVAAEITARADFDYVRYLTHFIDYHFDDQKQESVREFLKLKSSL